MHRATVLNSLIEVLRFRVKIIHFDAFYGQSVILILAFFDEISEFHRRRRRSAGIKIIANGSRVKLQTREHQETFRVSYDIAATDSTALVEAIDTSTLLSCAYGIAVRHSRTSRRTRGLVRQR